MSFAAEQKTGLMTNGWAVRESDSAVYLVYGALIVVWRAGGHVHWTAGEWWTDWDWLADDEHKEHNNSDGQGQ